MNSLESIAISNTPPSLFLPPSQPVTIPQNIEIIDIGTSKGLLPTNVDDKENEDVLEHWRLILQIKEYKQLLSHKLSGINLDGLDTLSTCALQDLLTDVEFTVSVSSSAATLKAMSEFNVVGGMFNTPGLGSALCINPEYVDTIHKVRIKYSSYIYQDSLLWLGLIVAQTAAVLHQMNRNQEIIRLATASVPPTFTEKFNSL